MNFKKGRRKLDILSLGIKKGQVKINDNNFQEVWAGLTIT